MEEEIVKRIADLTNLYNNQKINVDEFIHKMNYNNKENKLILEINPLGNNEEKNRLINREIIKFLKIDLRISGVKIVNNIVNDEVKINDNTKVIALLSGKGGVGKSQVTYNIAKELKLQGYNVGIVDADIYGYSIPKISKTYGKLKTKDNNIHPLVTKEGIEVISSQFFIENNQNEAIVWRGAKLNSLMATFFKKILFSQNLDYLLIDMPPGTGDVILNLPTYFEKIFAILITTPQEDAMHVALRSFKVAEMLKMKTIGIIENMSYLEINNKKEYIFGKNGGEKLAKDLNLELLGTVRIKTYENTDENYLQQDYQNIVKKILKKLKKEKDVKIKK